MGKTTLTVQDETLERFNAAKKTPEAMVEANADLFLNNLLDLYEDETVTMSDDSEAYSIPVLSKQLDRIESTVQTTEEQTEAINQELKNS